MNIAIIPARGGSKRIAGKNIRDFCGKPLIAYSIEAAKSCGLFEHVMVSTDDDKIRQIANAYGALTPFVRPAELADDHTTTVPVIKQAIEWIEQYMGKVEYACCIYATAPFIQTQSLRSAYQLLIQKPVAGYVFSATTFPFPIQRAFKLNPAGLVEMFEPHNYLTRSQDLEPAYQDAGQFYWGCAANFLSEKIFFSDDSVAAVLPRHMVQDIDTPEDWRRAELMYQVLQKNGDIA